MRTGLRYGAGIILAVALLGGAMAVQAGALYRVNVTRLDDDVYLEEKSGLIIRTRYCYEYVYYQDAIVVWDGPGFVTNKLIFDGMGVTNSCEIEGIYRR